MHELLSKISLEELAAFISVAETGSFTLAAQSIGRDPTILSRRVNHLENHLGVRLLSRTTRRVALTEVGGAYYKRIRALLDDLGNASLEASNLASAPQGLLRISLPVTFGRLWITPLLSGFAKKHPQIKLDVRFTDRLVDLVTEGFDVAIRVGSLRSSSLMAKKIASFKYILAASPAFVSTHGKPDSPEELSKFPCIGFISQSFWPEWNLKKNGLHKAIKPDGKLITDNSEAMLIAAIDGVGIALIADWLAGPAIRSEKLIEVMPGWEAAGAGESGIYAVMPPGRLVPTKTRLFVDEVTESIRNGWYKA